MKRDQNLCIIFSHRLRDSIDSSLTHTIRRYKNQTLKGLSYEIDFENVDEN